MAHRQKTAFDEDFEKNMRDPEFRAAYKRARARTDAIDKLVRTLDAERVSQGISKAELARRMGAQPEAIRRLFSTERPNPTMTTYIAAAQALGVRLRPVRPKHRTSRRQPAAA